MDESKAKTENVAVAQAEPAKAVIGPLGFHGYASEFLRASRQFQTDRRFSPVPYYLCCRSLELVLKAFLLGRGVTSDTLKRRIGHSLTSAVKRAKGLGINDFVVVTADHDREIELANAYYASKGFEYFNVYDAMTGYKNLPDLSILDSLAADLISKLETFCLEAT